MDCIAAGRRLPCSLCLPRQGKTIDFPPSPLLEGSPPLPILTPPRSTAVQKLPLQKKDKLKKSERILAEKHFADFGATIRQLERSSVNHNLYLPCSSYFPSHILSLILDQLLVIHFPAQLEDIVKNTWMHHQKHTNLLYDSIITFQILIKAQRTNKRAIANTKQRNRRCQVMEVIQDEDNSRPPSPAPTPAIEEPMNASVTRKRVATEDITNISKRRRAPRAIQPSVAQAFEDFGPKYRTRQRARVPEAISVSAEKENEPQATRSSLRLQKLN